MTMRSALCLVLLAGCGSSRPGGTPDSGPGAVVITRVEVGPGSLLFTGAGQSHGLTAKAFDGSGREVVATFTWSSSKPAQVSVDATGMVKAVTAIGSATVRAEAGGVQSLPVLVAAVQPKPGALLVTDAQVVSVGAPFAPPGAGPDDPNQMAVTLRNVGVPAPGTVVLATESAAVAGRIVSATQQGTDTAVVLEGAVFPDLLDRYDLDWELQLADYDLVMDDAPPGLESERTPSLRTRSGADTKIEKSFPSSGSSALKCNVELGAKLSKNLVTLTLKGDAKFVYKNSKNDATLPPDYLLIDLEGPLTLEGFIGLKMEAGFNAQAKCELKGRIPLRILGWVSLVISPAIPVGVGVALDGSLTLASLDLGLQGRNGVDLKLGLECGPTPLPCHSLDELHPINELQPKMTVPEKDPNMKLKLSAAAYALSGLDLQLLLGAFTAELASLTVGPVQSADLAFTDTQSNDKSYASNYDLKLEAKLAPGASVEKLVKKLMGEDPGKLGAELTISLPLATSPQGTTSVDKTSVAPGKPVHFTFNLDPASVTYFLLGYNVESIIVYSKKLDEPQYQQRTTIAASASNQTQFVWDWTPTREEIGKHEFVAFVKTAIPVIELEIAKDSSRQVEVAGVCLPSLRAAGGAPPGDDCTLHGTLNVSLAVDEPLTSTHILIEYMASLSLTLDPASSVPGALVYRPTGTWSMTHYEARTGICTFTAEPASGTLVPDDVHGTLNVYEGDTVHPPGLYNGVMATGPFPLTVTMVCEGSGPVTMTNQTDITLFIALDGDDHRVESDGRTVQGSTIQSSPTSRNTYTWDLVLDTPAPPGLRLERQVR